MSTSYRKTSVNMTKETTRQLDTLKLKLGENSTQIFSRAIEILYNKIIRNKKEE
jgi:predicted DNA-binding protein